MSIIARLRCYERLDHQIQGLDIRTYIPSLSMAKLIVVCGATGSQGGSVARRMLKEGWDVRAITRSVDGPAAQKLKSQGAELATANYDDEKSLIKAFEVSAAVCVVETLVMFGSRIV